MDQSQCDRPQWRAFAGVDWSGAHHQLCVLDGGGHRVTERRFPHDVAGPADLQAERQRHGEGLPVAVERSEGLLVEQLQAAGHVVFPVSPRIVARARERYKLAPVKDDRFDAFVLADTLRFEHAQCRPLAVASPLLAEIKALTRDRDRLLETQQATEHQLRMILEAYHPAPVRLFSSVDRQSSLSFVLDYPTRGDQWPIGARPREQPATSVSTTLSHAGPGPAVGQPPARAPDLARPPPRRASGRPGFSCGGVGAGRVGPRQAPPGRGRAGGPRTLTFRRGAGRDRPSVHHQRATHAPAAAAPTHASATRTSVSSSSCWPYWWYSSRTQHRRTGGALDEPGIERAAAAAGDDEQHRDRRRAARCRSTP